MKHHQLIDLLHENPDGMSLLQLCEQLNISEATFFRALQKARAQGAIIPKAKKKKYYLEFKPDPHPSLILSNKEKTAIQLAFQTLEKYRRQGIFKQTDNLILKLNTLLKIQIENQLQPIIQIESHANKGIEHVEEFIQLIQKGKAISIKYKKHGIESAEWKHILPIHLKEHKYIWYVYAQDIEDDYKIKVYGLDRIQNLRKCLATINYQKKIQKLDFPSTMYGLYPNQNEEIIEIKLEIRGFARDFILTHPLHSSQQIVETTMNSSIIQLNITPNNEFYSDILKFIPDIKVVSPEIIKVRTKKLVESIL